MKHPHDYMARFQELFHQLEEALEGHSPEKAAQQEAQLHNIEQTIRKLNKNNIPIPEELRQGKFRLMAELDHYKQLQEVKKKVLALSKEFVNQHQPKRNRSPKKPIGQGSLFDPPEP